MTLKEHIAKALMHSRIGMTRRELADAIDSSLYNYDINRISDALFHLKESGHVEKRGGDNNHTHRWSITPQGRAYYSDLHDDETDDQTQPAKADPIPPVPVDHRPQSDAEAGKEIQETNSVSPVVLDIIQESVSQPSDTQTPAPPVDQLVSDVEVARAIVTFNNAKKNLDQAFSNMLSLIIDVASQQPDTIAIENKAQALALLETLENNELYSGQHRATFARIRQAVELMEDAA